MDPACKSLITESLQPCVSPMTADGWDQSHDQLLHLQFVLDNDVDTSLDFKDIRVAFEHFTPPGWAPEAEPPRQS